MRCLAVVFMVVVGGVGIMGTMKSFTVASTAIGGSDDVCVRL